MKIKIPFTKKSIQIKVSGGGSIYNGNGYKNKTISFSIFTVIGNSDDEARTLTSKQNHGSLSRQIIK